MARTGNHPAATVQRSPRIMRDANVRAVLSRLLVDTPSSVQDLGGALGLTAPTVRVALAELERRGWVDVTDAPRALGQIGRTAKLASLRSEGHAVVALDVQPASYSSTVTDLRGEPLAEPRHRADTLDAAALRELHDQLAQVTRRRRLVAATAGVSGIVAVDGSTVFSHARDRQGGGPDLDALGDAVAGEGFALVNDVKLAAEAELAQGRLRDADTALYLTLDGKLGLALVVHGRVLDGNRGAAGELGLLRDAQWAEAGARIPDLARDRDAKLTDLVARIAPALAAAVATVDPDAIVVAGASEPVLAAVRRELAAALRTPSPLALHVVPATYEHGATLHGALIRSIGDAYSRIFGLEEGSALAARVTRRLAS